MAHRACGFSFQIRQGPVHCRHGDQLHAALCVHEVMRWDNAPAGLCITVQLGLAACKGCVDGAGVPEGLVAAQRGVVEHLKGQGL